MALPFPVADPHDKNSRWRWDYLDWAWPWAKKLVGSHLMSKNSSTVNDGGQEEDENLPIDANFWFFLFWYYGIYLHGQCHLSAIALPSCSPLSSLAPSTSRPHLLLSDLQLVPSKLVPEASRRNFLFRLLGLFACDRSARPPIWRCREEIWKSSGRWY